MKGKYNYSPLLNKFRLTKLRKERSDIRQKDRFLKKQTEEAQLLQQIVLPTVPNNLLDWTLKMRPTIDGRKNIVQYMPMLQRLHEDTWGWIMIKFARQMTKSAYLATRMGSMMTTKPNQKTTFCTFEDEALTAFSRDKFRTLWSESEIARQYVDGSTLGSLSSIRTKNNSSANLVTAVNSFRHVEGKSVNLLIFDEGQNLELEEWVTAGESQSFTNGKFIIAGIGGYKETEYDKWWKSTDQRNWIYSNEYWRDKLEFNQNGLVWDEYMLDVLAGYWKQTIQENQSRHGYYANQYQAPWIPLKKIDCEKYRLPESKSIQWKREEYTANDFSRHVLAEEIAGEVKPLLTEDMDKLFDPNVRLTLGKDVDYDLGPVIVGIDWGGGGKTIVWIWQCIDDKAPIFKLLWVEKVETNDTKEQTEICFNLIDAYNADFVGIDAGGAPDRVQAIQKRYGNRTIKISYHPRPERPLPTKSELKMQRKEMRYVIDRTFSIDRIIGMIKYPVIFEDDKQYKIILPGANKEELRWVIQQFVALEGELTNLKSTGQKYIKYTHKDSQPDDALQACNYAYIGWDIFRGEGSGHYGGPMPKNTSFGYGIYLDNNAGDF